MRAILFSAGRGSRLGKLTEAVPKCLLKIGIRNMLEQWFYLFEKYGVDNVLINTHYLAEQVHNFCIKNCRGRKIKVTLTYESELLGTAKTLYDCRDFFRGEKYFIAAFADTWMQVDLRTMLKFHKKRNGLGTIGLYKPKNLSDQGVVKIEDRKIVKIEEKSKTPVGEHAYAGVMIGTNGMFKFYSQNMTDLVGHWFPVIKDGLNPFFINDHVLDIGTPERYKTASEIVSGLGMKAL